MNDISKNHEYVNVFAVSINRDNKEELLLKCDLFYACCFLTEMKRDFALAIFA